MIVELAGSPCSGKTFLKGILWQQLAEKQVGNSDADKVFTLRSDTTLSRFPLIFHYIANQVCNTDLAQMVNSYGRIVASRGAAGLGLMRIKFSIFRKLSSFYKSKKRNAGNVVFDEGSIQVLYNIFADTNKDPPGELLEKCFKELPKPDILVLVSAESRTLAERLAGRGHWRIENPSHSVEVSTFIENAQNITYFLRNTQLPRIIHCSLGSAVSPDSIYDQINRELV